MAQRDTLEIKIAGHDIKMTAEAEERVHLERAAEKVGEAISKLNKAVSGAATPAKVATMVALQFAFELSLADEMLADAERLHEELAEEKAAVKRLEALLARVDDALAY